VDIEEQRARMAHARTFASEWHGSDEGIEFHKGLGKLSWEGREPDVKLVCYNCGGSFLSFRDDMGDRRFCSRECINQHNTRTKRYYTESSICKNCRKEFPSRKHDNQKFCSRACYSEFRRSK